MTDGQTSGQLKSFLLATKEQFAFLCSSFGVAEPFAEIHLDVRELRLKRHADAKFVSLDSCRECIRAQMQKDAEAVKSFVKKPITIRQADTGRSTSSKYQLRRKPKGSAGGAAGGGGGGGGSSFTVVASATDTVETTKLAIFSVTEIEPARIVLQFGGATLDDESRTLNSYGIGADAMLEMTTLLLDGADEEAAASSSARDSQPRARNSKPEKGFQGSMLVASSFSSSKESKSPVEATGIECPKCTFVEHSGTGVCSMCNSHLQPSKRNKSSE